MPSPSLVGMVKCAISPGCAVVPCKEYNEHTLYGMSGSDIRCTVRLTPGWFFESNNQDLEVGRIMKTPGWRRYSGHPSEVLVTAAWCSRQELLIAVVDLDEDRVWNEFEQLFAHVPTARLLAGIEVHVNDCDGGVLYKPWWTHVLRDFHPHADVEQKEGR